MSSLFAQGDLLIERLDEQAPPTELIRQDLAVLGGERSGHSHRVIGKIGFYKDAFAEIVDELYCGHLIVACPIARVVHEDHAPLFLPTGTYRLRKQRTWDWTKRGASVVED